MTRYASRYREIGSIVVEIAAPRGTSPPAVGHPLSDFAEKGTSAGVGCCMRRPNPPTPSLKGRGGRSRAWNVYDASRIDVTADREHCRVERSPHALQPHTPTLP